MKRVTSRSDRKGAWIGFTLLRASSAPAQDPSKEGADEKRSITPLILFAASPGTITRVMTRAVVHAKLLLSVMALVAVSHSNRANPEKPSMAMSARSESIARRLLPILGWLPSYRRAWLL